MGMGKGTEFKLDVNAQTNVIDSHMNGFHHDEEDMPLKGALPTGNSPPKAFVPSPRKQFFSVLVIAGLVVLWSLMLSLSSDTLPDLLANDAPVDMETGDIVVEEPAHDESVPGIVDVGAGADSVQPGADEILNEEMDQEEEDQEEDIEEIPEELDGESPTTGGVWTVIDWIGSHKRYMLIQVFLVAFYTFNIMILYKLWHIIAYFFITRHNIPTAGVIPKENYPHITVQLPMYNEYAVAARIITAACNLDWPSDRLEIQVLDDSTDESLEISEATALHFREQGIDCHVVKRDLRVGYKAGALEYGRKIAKGEFFAIFDADFIPNADYLKHAVRYFYDGESKPLADVDMVQGTWTFINHDDDLLTTVQAIWLSGHFSLEQAIRNTTVGFFNFNGTAGMWRATAVERAGGWSFDTVTEDTELSYRAFLSGSRFVFLRDLYVPCELPQSMAAYKAQQNRWTKGFSQISKKLLFRILWTPTSILFKMEAMYHLLGNLSYVLGFICVSTYPLLLLIGDNYESFVPAFLIFFPLAVVVVFYLLAASQWPYPQSRWTMVLAIFPLLGMFIGMSFHHCVAFFSGFILSKDNEFVRTPKTGDSRIHVPVPAAAKKAAGILKKYTSTISWTTYVEFANAVILMLSAIRFFEIAPGFVSPFQFWFKLVGLTLASVSFFYVALPGFRKSPIAVLAENCFAPMDEAKIATMKAAEYTFQEFVVADKRKGVAVTATILAGLPLLLMYGLGLGTSPWVLPYIQGDNTPLSNTMLVTAIQSEPCDSVYGDFLTTRLMMSKTDYCSIHGCTVYAESSHLQEADGDAWFEVAFTKWRIFDKLLNSPKHRSTEWFIWMDFDTAVVGLDQLPAYSQFDHSQHHMVLDGAPLDSVGFTTINTGVILLKNCDWSRKFVKEVLSASKTVSVNMLKETLPDYGISALSEQGIVAYLLHTDQENRFLPHVRTGDQPFLSQMYWKFSEGRIEIGSSVLSDFKSPGYMVEETKYLQRGEQIWDQETRLPFAIHFFGCDPCNGDANAEQFTDNVYDQTEAERCNDAIADSLSYATFKKLDLLTARKKVDLTADNPDQIEDGIDERAIEAGQQSQQEIKNLLGRGKAKKSSHVVAKQQLEDL